jgi:hypothetical protein
MGVLMTTTTTPNMGLVLPVPGSESGPAWAQEINSALNVVDGHNHAGVGVQLTPASLNINADLSLNDNNLTNANAVEFIPLPLAPSSGLFLSSVFVVSGELYYRDSSNNTVKLTNAGSVNAAAGNITGLSSPAAVTYSGGNYTFQSSATNLSSVTASAASLGATVSGTKVTVQPPSVLANSYTVSLPTALPAGTSNVVTLDNSGNLSTNAVTGTGNAVFQTSPVINSPTITNATINTATISGATLPSPSISNPSVSGGNFGSPTINGTGSAAFGQLAVGGSGSFFKMRTFTGSVGPSSTAVGVFSYPSLTSIFGIIGLTQASGYPSTQYFSLTSNSYYLGTPLTLYLVTRYSPGNYGYVDVHNDTSSTLSYTFTVFYY